MPFVNFVETSFHGAKPPKPVDLVITDGDETLFPHNSAEPLDGALDYLGQLNPSHLALVSGNPDKLLAETRAEAIGADSLSIPRIPTLLKNGLFHHAITAALDRCELKTAAVLGNRWMMDVTMGRFALFNQGITDNYGVFFRLMSSNEYFDRVITGPIETVGAVAAKAFRVDGYIRPRRVEEV